MRCCAVPPPALCVLPQILPSLQRSLCHPLGIAQHLMAPALFGAQGLGSFTRGRGSQRGSRLGLGPLGLVLGATEQSLGPHLHPPSRYMETVVGSPLTVPCWTAAALRAASHRPSVCMCKAPIASHTHTRSSLSCQRDETPPSVSYAHCPASAPGIHTHNSSWASGVQRAPPGTAQLAVPRAWGHGRGRPLGWGRVPAGSPGGCQRPDTGTVSLSPRQLAEKNEALGA